MASINNLPGVCDVAMRGGLHAANAIRRRPKSDARNILFRHRDGGGAVAIGRFEATVHFHGMRLSGFPGWVVWLFIHVAFLNGFGCQLSSLWRWATSMIGQPRPSGASAGDTLAATSSLPTRSARGFAQPVPCLRRVAEVSGRVRTVMSDERVDSIIRKENGAE